MTVRSTHLKLIGAAGAAALAIGALASPALAATSTASATYTCSTPLGDAHPSATYDVASAPTKMAAGQPLGTTATFTLDPGTTALAASLGWTKFNGTIKTSPSASRAGLSLKFPKTTLGNGAGGSTVANATGSTIAGTKVGPFTFVLGDLGDVVLTGYAADGSKVGSVEFPTAGSFGRCINDVGTTTLMSGATAVTTEIVKDSTKTKVTAAYSAKKDVAKGTAKVVSRFGLKPTGKVSFTLKKGTKKIATKAAKLNKKGVARVLFKGVKKSGKYSITAKYAGNSSLKRSSGRDTFTVK